MSIKSAIGLRQGALLKDISIQNTQNGFPKLVMTFKTKKTTHPKSEDRDFWHSLFTWKDMDEEARKRLKENCLQLLMAYEVNNAEAIISKKYTGGPAEFFQAVIDALPKAFKRMAVDIFLEYEYEKQKGKDRTWPTIATGASGEVNGKPWRSYWITAAQDGEFKPNVSEKDGKKILTFVNEEGVRHPISRGPKWFNGKNDLPQGEVPVFNGGQTEKSTTPEREEAAVEDTSGLPF